MRLNFMYKLFLPFIFLMGLQFDASAQFEEGSPVLETTTLIGTSIAPDSSRTTTYTAAGEDFHTLKNVVSFYINETGSIYFASGFNATVHFDLELTVNGVLSTQTGKTLTVNYDDTKGATKYNVRAYVVLPEQAEKVKVTITSISITGASGWTPISVLQLDNDIQALKYYNTLGSSTLTADSLTGTPSLAATPDKSDELRVSWAWDHQKYNLSQLEWAFIDSNMIDNYTYNLNSPDNIFQNNSTRVDIDFGKENYKIPLLYPAGNLFYRVRPALRRNSGNMITGGWSTAKMYVIKGHEDSLNWESSTSFAENQKYKSVVQYFDGSLRSRQTVTKDNTTGNTVVAETIYDLQGRPNIQILPTPAFDTTIKYFKDFNRFAGQQIEGTRDLRHYDDPAKYFDLSIVPCDTLRRLDISSGNGRYYSAYNDWLTGTNAEEKSKFIPDAQGFAYTETRFMDDATERVRSQGGVGIDHQIGSGHETRYWYGKPAQTEMDALFGTEVGDASHYSKNMVQDANGQVSVSYVDMHGRTVATALAGDPTPGIDSIINRNDYPLAGGTITDSLITAATNLIKGRSIESVSTLLVSASHTKYDFSYELNPAILKQLSCNATQICFDCKYDLEISIKSEDCGTAPVTRYYNNLQIVSSGLACDSSMGFSGDGFTNVKKLTFSDYLNTGSYIVRKTLTINDSMYQVRKDSALKVFLCKTQDSIYQSVYNAMAAQSGCDAPATSVCDSCLAKLGDHDMYRNKYLLSIGLSLDNTSLDAEISRYYAQDSLECANACGGLNPELSTLQTIRNQMLSDMTPFTGQYALPLDSIKAPFSTEGTDYTRIEAKFNIFSENYNGTPRTAFYRDPLTETEVPFYLTDEDQVDSSIHRHDESLQPILDTISAPEFTSLFQSSWAKSLIKRHPEYEKLKYAEDNLRSSYDWLDKVRACETYEMAEELGYLNPTNKVSATPYPSIANDPFFAIPANSDLRDTINKWTYEGLSYDPEGNPVISIWQIANASVLCATADSLHKPGCIEARVKTGIDPLITDPVQKNKAWEQFRNLYLTIRNEMVLSYINSNTSVLSDVDRDSLLSQGKQLVFASIPQTAMQNNWTAWSSVMNGDTAAIRNAAVMSDTTDNCNAQRPFWKAKLLQCEVLVNLLNNELGTDSVTVNTIIDNILDSMVLVCHQSVNAQQPLGASNVNPAYAGLPQNFEQVINGVLFHNGIDTTATGAYFCNPYTIDFPKPYGKNPPLFVNNTNIIDTCGCKRFAELKSEAKMMGFDTLSLSGPMGMNEFLQTNYQDTLSNILWAGLQRCSEGFFKDTCFFTSGLDSNATAPCTECAPDNTVCGQPVLYSVSYLNNTSVNNVKISYRTSTGGPNCYLTIYNTSTFENFFKPLGGGLHSDTVISLPACQRYAIQIGTGTPHGEGCYDTSNSHILSACINDCKTIYSPIYLADVVVMPPFLSCGYQKPCINCAKLDSLIAEFKTKFPTMTGVPHLFSDAITDVQANENNLWARFLNYRTGFSKNELEYIAAYQNCKTESGCGVNAGVNDLILTARSLPYPTEYKARVSITLKTGFASNYGDDYLISINPALDSCTGSSISNSSALCASFKPVNNPSLTIDITPCQYVQNRAGIIAQMLFIKMQDSLIAHFDSLYKATCLTAQSKEKFYVKYTPKEYHYTLYYYDLAGNLVKTLAPAGVKPNFRATFLDSVVEARNNGADLTNYANNEALATSYRYNSLNQVIVQKTPDAGISNFWYDRLGRLVVSQNAKQQLLSLYSYTLYDPLGRITEVGEKPQITAMLQSISQDTAALQGWIDGTGIKEQITRTIYDEAYTPMATSINRSTGLYQKNLRNRVSYTYVKDQDDQAADWNAATFYTYDIHGNVDTLMQDYQTSMGVIACIDDTLKANRFKKMVYGYDLISGKVNDVAYQPGHQDQFYHRYDYDAENRLIKVETSKDKTYWEREAIYDYYRHGSLARTVLGQNQVQGLDYAYTIQGWLKGVNSTAVLSEGAIPTFDMGKDGFEGNNSLVSRDIFGFSLNYYNSDYKSISTSVTPFASIPLALPAGTNGLITGSQLFNGNIAAMAENLGGNSKVYGYRYDQLNRLVQMDAFNSINNGDNTFTPTYIDDYHEAIRYDPNGNIKTYLRNGTTQGESLIGMDNLGYRYKPNTNQLDHVTDSVAATNYSIDIDNQDTLNYTYDEIGNLTKDVAEGISDIDWTVYGKIRSITKTNGTTIKYSYDASGNRISKIVSTGDSTYYVRDASGNVMSVYSKKGYLDLSQTELHLYGSSRLGVYNVNVDVQNCYNSSGPITIFTRGNKFFELTNHLGNVLVTVSDRKVQRTNDDVTVDFYVPDFVTANGYYPFGMQMPGRTFKQAGSDYRYGFNGKEKSDEVYGDGNVYDYGFRIYNPRLGRFLSTDPLSKSYPWYTPYQFAGNKPIIAIDLDGLEEKTVVNMAVAKVKPATQGPTAITILDITKASVAGINFIMSNLQLKEVQQKQLVGPPTSMNPEFQSAYLSLEESEKIIRETIIQFTIQSGSRYSENRSADLSVVTEIYNVHFDFNYSLLGDENTISNFKSMVSKTMTAAEYGADISGSKLLNKISSKGGIASSVVNQDYQALTEAAITTTTEKLLSNKYSFLTTIFKGAAPKVAGAVVNILSLSLTNTAPQTNIDAKEEKADNLRARTAAALLIFFETGNKTKPGLSPIPPSYSDNTHLPKPIPIKNN